MKLTSVCKTCGKEFKYYQCHGMGIFCSSVCHHLYARGKNNPRYKEKLMAKCKQCGKELSFNPCFARTKKFCSQKCKQLWERQWSKGSKNPNWKGGNIQGICQWCNKPFEMYRWQHRKYCSIACKAKAQGLQERKYRTCTNCGKLFHKKRVLGRKRYFCSYKCMGIYNKGKNNPFYQKKFSRESLMKILNKVHARPNNPERMLMELMEKHDLPFRYVGGGNLIIGGKNPDFIDSLEKRKVIELFGNYWHSPLFRPKKLRPTMTYGAISRHYAEHGYGCLIIWEGELANPNRVLERIQEYVGGAKIALNVPK